MFHVAKIINSLIFENFLVQFCVGIEWIFVCSGCLAGIPAATEAGSERILLKKGKWTDPASSDLW